MPPPVVRLAFLPDGSRVAYHVLGSGPALVMLFPYHMNHLSLNWRVPLHRGATEFLARHFTVINLDFPGAGLSDRLAGELSLRTLSAAVSAVLTTIGAERASVCAMGAAALVACDFAARRPGNVAAVVFISGGESEANRQLLHLRQIEPDAEAEARGALLAGIGDGRNVPALAELARSAVDRGSLAGWERLLERERLLPLASAVSAPALYVHAAEDRLVALSSAEAMAARLPRGTLTTVPGRSGMDVWRSRAAVQRIVAFLQEAEHADTPRRRTRRPRGRQHPAGLSEREVEVVRLLAAGRTNRQIAHDLFISLNTVSHHLRNIFAKTRASNRTQAAAFAYQAGLTPHR